MNSVELHASPAMCSNALYHALRDFLGPTVVAPNGVYSFYRSGDAEVW